MAQLIIVYWRDIPAQVIVKQGRRSAKRELPERFVQAIDMAAMRSGAAATDDYLADWRRAEPVECGDDLEAEAEAAARRLEAEYDADAVKRLVANKGRAAPAAD
jgi:hypothetical protein